MGSNYVRPLMQRELIQLYRAALADDWKTAKIILIERKGDVNPYITNDNETLLHIAVETNRSHHFVKELVKLIVEKGDKEMLKTTTSSSTNVLHYAARVGNTEAVRLLVKEKPDMPQIADPNGGTPLELAALYGRRETLYYLLEVTKDVVDGEDGTSPYRGHHGVNLLNLAVTSGFCDVARKLVGEYPDLVTEEDCLNSRTLIQTLAARPDLFTSGSELGYWKRIIYSRIPVPLWEREWEVAGYGNNGYFWPVLQYLAPPVKEIHANKVKNVQAEELVNVICTQVINITNIQTAWSVMGAALPIAVEHGTHEIIELFIHDYGSLVWHDVDRFQLFRVAIINRQEKFYRLLKQTVGHKLARKATEDGSGNNLLHFAGKLAPPHCLNKHTGAALQLQCELQWFKEIESFVEPIHRQAKNKENKTPRMVFTSEHKELLKEAREWMKNASSSATVVAALIVTVAFAAIFTAPGGNDPLGKSLLLDDPVFILFAISDAGALFSASTSVLMFLALLNSRFAEEDFLYALPNRLLLALVSLSISIAATMVAFGSTLALLLRHRIQWIAAPVTFLAVIPVFSFLSLQYPLLVELFSSAYGRGIFYKQNKHFYYRNIGLSMDRVRIGSGQIHIRIH